MPQLYKFEVRRVEQDFTPVDAPDPQTVYEYFCKETWTLDREHFFVLGLDSWLSIVSYEVVAVGGLAGVEVHPREVFRGAILTGAHAIIVAHNHPTGDLTPSNEDRALYTRLCAAGEILGIEVLDALILGHGEYLSMANEG